jgi:hypothetical protein
MENFNLVIDELIKLNLYDSSIQSIKNIIENNQKENIIDFFSNLLIVFETNHKIMNLIQFDNINEFIIEFLLFFCEKNTMIIDKVLLSDLLLLIRKLVIFLCSDILYENLEKKRFKLLRKK